MKQIVSLAHDTFKRIEALLLARAARAANLAERSDKLRASGHGVASTNRRRHADAALTRADYIEFTTGKRP
jgi:hypothetical protein